MTKHPSNLEMHVQFGSQYYAGSWHSFLHFLAKYLGYRIFPTNKELGDCIQKGEHPIIPFLQADGARYFCEKGGVDLPDELKSKFRYLSRCALHTLVVDSEELITDKLLNRLKNPRNFWGAMHEIFVISYFIISGCKLVFEDENDASQSHCEFTAIFDKNTKLDVEAKSKHRDNSVMCEEENRLKLARIIKRALQKKANNHRAIFIDINIPSNNDNDVDIFIGDTINTFKHVYELDNPENTWPDALFFFTNFPERMAHVSGNFYYQPQLYSYAVQSSGNGLDHNLSNAVDRLKGSFDLLLQKKLSFNLLDELGVRYWFQ